MFPAWIERGQNCCEHFCQVIILVISENFLYFPNEEVVMKDNCCAKYEIVHRCWYLKPLASVENHMGDKCVSL